ncbi:MAG: hypothetical protein K6F50_04785 [Kiritimatiellae bacterium]|nr:hypothetical protein [Kiritimatiellia bacterium]
MTRKTYCGNLLWQSGLTLLAPASEPFRKHVGVMQDAGELTIESFSL